MERTKFNKEVKFKLEARAFIIDGHLHVEYIYPSNFDRLINNLRNFLPTKVLFYNHSNTNIKTLSANNSNVKRGRPDSDVKEKNKQYLPIAKKLAKIIESNKKIKIKESHLAGWSDEIRKLIEIDKIEPTRIHKVLNWYDNNIGRPYVPIVLSAWALREKFIRLEDAIGRIDNKSYGKATTIIGWQGRKGYLNSKNGKYYTKGGQLITHDEHGYQIKYTS